MRFSRPRLLLLGVAVGVGLFASREGWVRAAEARNREAEARKELAAAESERQSVARRIASAESPVGQEENARARGFRRPEELPVDAR